MSELDELMTFLRTQPPASETPLAERRALYDRAEKAFALPDGVSPAAWSAGAVPGERLTVADAAPGRHILYLHGGGYGIGSPRSHRHLAAAIGVAARAEVVVPDYRLAPEHPYPAALEDAIAAHDRLCADAGAGDIVVAGDSAGGGLVVAALARLHARGGPQPLAGVCLSPWVDLACDPASEMAKACAGDPLVDYDGIAEYAGNYLGAAPADDPGASPIHAELAGLPPLLIQASSAEALRFDAERLAAKAREAGVETELEMTPDVPHVWQWFWPRLQRGRESIERIGGWLEPRWSAS